MSYPSLVPQHPSRFPSNEDRRKISIYHQPLMAQEFVLITLRAHKYMYRVFVWWMWIWCGDGWSHMCVLVCQNGLICVCVSQGPCVSDKRTWCVLFMRNDHTNQRKEEVAGWGSFPFGLSRILYALSFWFRRPLYTVFRPPSHDVLYIVSCGCMRLCREWEGWICRYLYEGTYRLCYVAPVGLVHLDWVRYIASGRKVHNTFDIFGIITITIRIAIRENVTIYNSLNFSNGF